jgi:hypothetical protein
MCLRPTTRLALLVIACLVVPTPLGCNNGPPSGKVRGKVTFKGQPVKEGRVTFLNPKEGGTYEALLAADGGYAVQGRVAVGDYVIEISPLMEIKDTDPGKSPPAPVEKKAPDIPKKYRMQGTTPLKATVKQGDNEINFEMTP